jgi:hypothetical protein
VAVIEPLVNDEKIAVIPEMSEEKKLVEVLFVVVRLVIVDDENIGASVRV